ncbi:hypothetical protein [Nostoc piscinale]|uniref:hypothetical protein n=1 Tax=Nostoc piscinale TaxID=224012 RepID=UPI001F21BC34|nr:hypothetical protein [Nostoc piscinale]
MQIHNKQIPQWILSPILMSLVISGTVACQFPVNSSVTNQAIAKPVATLAQTPGTYRSDRFRFRFSYSTKDFVIDNKISTPRNNVDVPLAAIDIWTKQHAQKNSRWSL